MQTRLLVNLGLFIFLSSLFGFIFFSPTDNDSNNIKKITSLDKTSINKITILREAEAILLVKKNNTWFMKSPHTTRAHTFRINSLLNLLELETSDSYNAEDLNLKKFSLDKPRAKIKFNNTLIEFGKTNPINYQRYLKIGKKLFLVDDNLYPLISSQPTSFVDLSLLSTTDKIKKLRLPELIIFKDNSKWKTTPQENASADEIQTLLQNWQFARAFAVHAYMPRKNLGKIDITLDDKKMVSFEITDDEPWLILARPELGIEYHLDASSKNKLLSIQKQKK